MPQEYDDHSNMQEIPVSQAMSFDGFEEVKPSSFETSTQRITKKGLRYQDMAMIVKWDQDGLPEIQMELKTEHGKATSTSQNLILFILAISLANGPFKDYNTVDDIFNVGAPRCNRLILDGPITCFACLFSGAQHLPALLERSKSETCSLNSRRAQHSDLSIIYLRPSILEVKDLPIMVSIRKPAEENVYSFLSPVFEIDQLQMREATPTAACPKGQTPTANSQEHSAVNQIEKAAVTLDNTESTKTEELRELPITGPAGDGRFLSACGLQANQHDGLILTVRWSRSNRQQEALGIPLY